MQVTSSFLTTLWYRNNSYTQIGDVSHQISEGCKYLESFEMLSHVWFYGKPQVHIGGVTSTSLVLFGLSRVDVCQRGNAEDGGSILITFFPGTRRCIYGTVQHRTARCVGAGLRLVPKWLESLMSNPSASTTRQRIEEILNTCVICNYMHRQQNHKDFGGHANLPPGHQVFAENTGGSKTTQWRRRRWLLLTQHSSLASPTFVLSPLCRLSFGLPMIGIVRCSSTSVRTVCPMSYIFHFRISLTSLRQLRSERAPLSIDSRNCIKHLHPMDGQDTDTRSLVMLARTYQTLLEPVLDYELMKCGLSIICSSGAFHPMLEGEASIPSTTTL